MSRALADLLDDDPITLAEASRIVLKGAVGEQALRAEIRRGNLQVERLGRNLFTTPAYIRAWREKCRVQQNRPASISARTSQAERSGSSGTATGTDELAALRATAKALKNGSLNTSPKSTQRGPQGAANPIPFPSRK